MSLLTYLSAYQGTLNDKTMSWLKSWSPWMPNGTMEDLWMAFLQGYQGSLNDRMLAWARATSGLSGSSLNDALLGLPDGGAQYGGASLGLYFDEDKYESGAVGAQPTSKPFSNIITFTRASGGGRFNAAGVYEWLGNDVPRLDYDPVTLQPRGLLIEEQRTRLNTVSTGATLITPTRATYVADGTLFIDGTTPFRKLVEDTSNNSHFGVPAVVSLLANTTYTAQYVVKAAGRTKFRVEAESVASWAGSNPRVTYDLTAVTATGTGGATGTIKDIGGGRFIVTFTATTGATPFSSSIYPILLDASGNSSYTGDGVSGIYIAGYQLEAGAFATSLIVGEGSQVTRSADVASVNTLSPWYNASEGTFLLEVQKTAASPIFLALDTRNSINQQGVAIGSAVNPANRTVDIASRAADSSNFLTVGSYVSGSAFKVAMSFSDGDMRGCVDGGAVSSAVRSVGQHAGQAVWLGRSNTGFGGLNGHIRNISYYPRRLSDSELQGITA